MPLQLSTPECYDCAGGSELVIGKPSHLPVRASGGGHGNPEIDGRTLRFCRWQV